MRIIQGDSLEVLKTLPDESVNCCVTSPPYYGLRDYGTATWIGGDQNCSHRRETKKSEKTITGHKNFDDMLGVGDAIYKDVCPRCGAKRVDNQVGLEETPEKFVQKLVLIFRELKRVLKKDGTLWLNIGDSYAGGGFGTTSDPNYDLGKQGTNRGTSDYETRLKLGSLKKKVEGVKTKDLIGIPWMVAFALRADGWYLRQDIIWHKPNPMPEPVKDRCVKSHEYIFLLSKSKKYYFDYEAIQEESVCAESDKRFFQGKSKGIGKTEQGNYAMQSCRAYQKNGMRNKRDVWSVSTKPYSEAHFATYPEELITPCIMAGCPKGGIVLDPFSGAGTTGRVAIDNGREYIGIELNSEYIKIQEKRLMQTSVWEQI